MTNPNYYFGKLDDTYQIGKTIEISDVNHNNMTSNMHVLAYCGNCSLDHLRGKKLSIAGIYPMHNMMAGQSDSFIDLYSLSNTLIQDSYDECQKMNGCLDQGTIAFCDMSTCCYIILSLGMGANTYSTVFPRYESSHQHEADNLAESIAGLYNAMNQYDSVLKYNTNHKQYRELIEKSCELESGTPERQYEGIAFAWLLLNTERSETALRKLNSSGEIKDCEDYDIRQVRDIRFNLLNAYARRFLKQASSLNDQCQIWATLNFSMFLLELALANETSYDIGINFMGLYPTIDEDDRPTDSLCTIVPMMYSPVFTYAFLSIPSDMRYRVGGYFREMLHELFHYIPSKTRESQARLIFHMFAYRILGNRANSDDVALLVDFLQHHYKRLGHDTTIYQDSMSFISIMRVILNRIDIADYFKNQGRKIPCQQDFLSTPEQHEHILSYTFFLREIRSDISMIQLLNANDIKMGLKEYIVLMAGQPDWATLSANEISIESILRFGYMTTWIKHNIPGNADLNIQSVIEQLGDECKDATLKQKYGNLKQYLNKYRDEWQHIDRCGYDLECLVSMWKSDIYLLNIKLNPFWEQFLKLYDNADFDRTKYDIDMVIHDYGVKLILLNLPHYKQYFL